MVLAGRGRTLSGHQNQRPSSAAIDGVMKERTINVSKIRPTPIVVPIWASTSRSPKTKPHMVKAKTRPAAVTTEPVPAMVRISPVFRPAPISSLNLAITKRL